MSAHDPQDQHTDTPAPDDSRSPGAQAAPPAHAGGPAGSARTPSVRDLLASCAAAHTVSTPPSDDPAGGPRKDAAA